MNINSKKLVLSIVFSAVIAACMFVAPIASASSGVPNTLSYQGTLTDSGGNALGGPAGTSYYFRFSIWDSPTVGQGSKLWPSSAPGSVPLSVRLGVFNVNIGDTTNGYPDALNYDFNTNQKIYLQVEVSSDNTNFETLSPRSSVTSAAFAQVANQVSGTNPTSFGTTTSFANTLISAITTGVNQVAMTIKGIAGQVANLFNIQDSNGNFLFSVASNGNVGVGTSTPASKLDVFGNLRVGTSSAPVLFVNTATGNVGVGTTAPASILTIGSGQLEIPVGLVSAPSLGFTGDLNTGLYSSGADKIDIVAGGTTLAHFGTDSSYIRDRYGNNSVDTTNRILYNVSVASLRWNGDGVNTILGTTLLPSYSFTGDANTGMWSPTADTIAWSVGGGEGVRIDSAGRVGIGTTSPSAKLSVTGTAGATDIINFASSTNSSLFKIAATGAVSFNNQTGNIGDVLLSQGLGASPLWVATSTLGIGGASVWTASSTDGVFSGNNLYINGSTLYASSSIDFVGLGKSNPKAVRAIFIGSSAGTAGATDAIAIGYFAANAVTGGNAPAISMGYYTGSGSSGGSGSVFLGTYAGKDSVGATNSNFIGTSAGQGTNSNASYSNFLGYEAGLGANAAYRSNFLGINAGGYASAANNSNFLGNNAGYNAINAANSTFMGYYAGRQAGNAANSIFIGYNAGNNDSVNNTSGNKSSILIGNYTSTGGFSNSVAIGQGVANSAIDQMSLGNVLFLTNISSSTTATSTAMADPRVGVGISSPLFPLHIYSANTASTINSTSGVGGYTMLLQNPGSATGQTIGIGFKFYNLNGYIKSAIIAERTSNGAENLMFAIRPDGDATNATSSDAAFKIFPNKASVADSLGIGRIGTTTAAQGYFVTGTEVSFPLTINASTSQDGVALVQRMTTATGQSAGILFGTSATGNTGINGYHKAGIFFERTATGYGKGKLHLAMSTSNDGTDAAGANAVLTVDETTLVGIGSTTPSARLSVAGLAGSTNDIFAVATSTNARYFTITSAGKVGIGSSTPNYLVSLSGGAYSDGATWTNASSKALKENFVDLNKDQVLTKIASLDIKQWNYISDSNKYPHIGPFAEDFYNAFSLGGNTGAISSVDPAGVALIGIQALKEKLDSFFIEVKDGIAYFKKIAVESLTIGKSGKPSGITMYDEVTGQPYCVKIINGQLRNEPGECSSGAPSVVNQVAAPAVSGVSNPSTDLSTGGPTTDNVTSSTTSSDGSVDATVSDPDPTIDSTSDPAPVIDPAPAADTPTTPAPSVDAAPAPAPAPEAAPAPAPAPVSE